MALPLKRWIEPPPVSPQELRRFPTLRPLVVRLLVRQGIQDLDQAYNFLAWRAPADDPAQLKGLPEAVDRLWAAIRGGEQIAVYGDFDADGVTATALLVEVLARLGGQVRPYIPDRVDEGYGLNLAALRSLYKAGVRLVVTVDCGVRSIAEVSEAPRGLDLIITDHHKPAAELPPALAIVNPHQPGCPYPFKGLAGVGLAFKLAQGLLRTAPQPLPAAEMEDSWLDLVALGTVADLAPLTGENRALVRRGLARLNTAARPGVQALMDVAGVRPGRVDAAAIGFQLGPRLNAAGRIESAMTAYQLLISRDPEQVQTLSARLNELNRHRQEQTEQTFVAARDQVLARDGQAYLYLAADRAFLPGIVGLAASRLTDAYYRPSIVVVQGDEESRGSCRSIPEFDITDALDQCQQLLIRHGGHAAAAGFTVATANLDLLRAQLLDLASRKLRDVELRPALHIDHELALYHVGETLHALLQKIEPCGAGNPVPILLSRDVEVRERWVMGSEGKHLKLLLRDGRGIAWPATFFRQGHLRDQVPDRVDVAYCLEMDEWNHEKRLQLNVQDLRPAQVHQPSPA